MKAKSISIACVETDATSNDLARHAIERALMCVPAREVLFFGTEPLNIGERFIRIHNFTSIDSYSEFVFKCLWPFIETDQLMMVQWDGYPTRRELWDEDFLAFDYIGAPWIWGEANRRVGNGGFSIRSRALMLECSHPQLRRHPEVEGGGAEDVVICKVYGEYLESRGLRFAPLDVANRFAVEYATPAFPSFGFHGPWQLPLHEDEATLLQLAQRLKPKLTRSPVFPKFIEACQQVGYHSLLEVISTPV